ncbi:hypothetical protein ACFSTC_08945 [Nonomuraea ferruginea]
MVNHLPVDLRVSERGGDHGDEKRSGAGQWYGERGQVRGGGPGLHRRVRGPVGLRYRELRPGPPRRPP